MIAALRGHRLLAGLAEPHLAVLAGCARDARYDQGAFLFHEGEDADACHLLLEGRVALELHAPGRDPLRCQTVSAGEAVGLSWLSPPAHWAFDARAVKPVRSIVLDAAALNAAADADPAFGYALLRALLPALLGRLHATRLQLLDLYSHARG